jgi:hypothetical protein
MRIRPALALLLCACSENTLVITKEGSGGEGPGIEVKPGSLTFGTLGQDDPAEVQSFVVRSIGSTDLTVSEMSVEGEGAGSFTLLSETTFVLPPGAEQEIEVAFVPMGASDQEATALVYSDDEARSIAPVQLLGGGAVPELSITPNPIDFGVDYVGCPKSLPVELRNIGTDTLTISNISWSGDAALSLVNDWALPIVLDPDQSTTLTVSFTADTEMEAAGELSVTSNEPMGVRQAPVVGEGKYAATYVDSWEVPTDPPSDIIFSVDQSCSMDDDIAKLAADFSDFITELSSYSNDWQVLIANADDGCNNGGVLSPAVSGYASRFSSAIQSDGGGLHTESLLTIGALAAEKAGTSGCNAGFLREDALLHLIQVSDEPEQSPYTSGYTWDALVTRMADAKGSASMTRVSAIAGPVPSGCATADAGTGYAEAVAATGGVFLSICSDWTSPANLALLAEASINLDTFALEHTPVPETIEVKVDGAVRTSWTYDSTNNAVVFTSAAPSEGQVVDIAYAGLATCD